jgi:hypothetical protein
MTTTPPADEHRAHAICPECRLEVTGSKRVETLRSRPERGPGGEVFWCPECGRFFTVPPKDSSHDET